MVTHARRERAAVGLARMQDVDLSADGAGADGGNGPRVLGDDEEGIREGGVLEIDEIAEEEDPTKQVLAFEVDPSKVRECRQGAGGPAAIVLWKMCGVAQMLQDVRPQIWSCQEAVSRCRLLHGKCLSIVVICWCLSVIRPAAPRLFYLVCMAHWHLRWSM